MTHAVKCLIGLALVVGCLLVSPVAAGQDLSKGHTASGTRTDLLIKEKISGFANNGKAVILVKDSDIAEVLTAIRKCYELVETKSCSETPNPVIRSNYTGYSVLVFRYKPEHDKQLQALSYGTLGGGGGFLFGRVPIQGALLGGTAGYLMQLCNDIDS